MEALLDAFGIDWKLLIAQAVNFGVLFVALSYFLYKPVLRTLEERRDKVAKGVRDAEAAAETLKGAGEKASRVVRGAEAEAETIVAGARIQASEERTRLIKEAEERAAGTLKDAEARAEEAKARALRESEKEIARLAILAAEKAMRKEA